MKITTKERTGSVGYNNFGSKMEIIEYNSYSDIWVKFESGNPIHTNYGNFKKGNVRNPYDRTVYEVGYIGEGEYKPSVNRKLTAEYNTWNSMLRRCYDLKYIEKHPSYIECSVINEWHCFQTFSAWYNQNYYKCANRMELDKDILNKGNKTYSPDSCVFVPQAINNLFVKRELDRGTYPIGVSFNKKYGKFAAYFSKGNGERETIGFYSTPEEAFKAYKIHKEDHIKQVAEEYKNIIPIKLYQALLKYEVDITD